MWRIKEMNRKCFIYLCHVFCEESIRRYKVIKRSCDKCGYDVWWFYDNTHNDYFKHDEVENVYCFNKEHLLRDYGQLIYLSSEAGF